MTLMLESDAPAPTTTVPPTARLDVDAPLDAAPVPATAVQVAPLVEVAPLAETETSARGWVALGRGSRPVLSRQAARLCGLGSFLAFAVGVAVQPAPNGPAPVMVWWADALNTATLIILLASWIALAVGRRSGLWTGAVAGLSLVTLTALCPPLGHHTIAGWWWAQLATGIGITLLNAGMLGRTRSATSRFRG
jgi:hypothetical protein